jgi:hypothetical protein
LVEDEKKITTKENYLENPSPTNISQPAEGDSFHPVELIYVCAVKT